MARLSRYMDQGHARPPPTPKPTRMPRVSKNKTEGKGSFCVPLTQEYLSHLISSHLIRPLIYPGTKPADCPSPTPTHPLCLFSSIGSETTDPSLPLRCSALLVERGGGEPAPSAPGKAGGRQESGCCQVPLLKEGREKRDRERGPYPSIPMTMNMGRTIYLHTYLHQKAAWPGR